MFKQSKIIFIGMKRSAYYYIFIYLFILLDQKQVIDKMLLVNFNYIKIDM